MMAKRRRISPTYEWPSKWGQAISSPLFQIREAVKASVLESHRILTFLSSVQPMISAAEKARDTVSQRIAPHFTSFQFISPDENSLSDIIAQFLDPNGRHGQRDVFLKSLLARLGMKGESTSGVTVKREAYVLDRGGFIDILLEAPKWRIVIENKPWAGDQDKQLERYWTHITRGEFNPARCRLVYLSANGQQPSAYSLSKKLRDELSLGPARLYGISLGPLGDEAVQLASYPTQSFDEIIQEWVALARPANVQQFLHDFGDYINNTFGEPEDIMQEKSEALAGMIRESRQMTEAALHTADAAEYIRAGITNNFFRAIEDEVLSKLGDAGECSSRISNTAVAYRSFEFWKKSDLRNKLVYPMLELSRDGRLIVGIRAPGAKIRNFKKSYPDSEPVADKTKDELKEVVNTLIPNAKSNAWWASYNWVTSYWPNLNTTEGFLFMLDATEKKDDSSGPIAEIVSRSIALAEAVDRYFRK